MAQAIMVVESRPRSEEDTAAYHEWYDEVHIPELLAINGEACEDVIDVQFYSAEEWLELEIRRGDKALTLEAEDFEYRWAAD